MMSAQPRHSDLLLAQRSLHLAPGDGTLARLVDDRPMTLHVRVVAGTGGGPDKTILRSPKWIDSDRMRMAAAYIHPRNDRGIEVIQSQADTHGCPLHTIAESGPADPRTVSSLARLCRRLGVTVWHGHDYKSNLLGLVLRRQHAMKLVTTVHGWTNDTLRMRMYYHIDRWCLRRYDHVVTVSDRLRLECLTAGVAPSRLTMIHNAIDLSEYEREQDVAQARASLGISENAFVIGIVARHSIEKGVDRILPVLAQLRRKHPRVELHLIGDGPQRERLATTARELNLVNNTRFWGWQSDARRHFETMDLLLIPSRTEGLPNVALEAMALNVPVAATDVGDVRQVLDDGRCGVVLDNDESRWAAELEPLIISRARREELARRGRERVESHYSFDVRMRRMMRVYDNMLGTESDAEARAAA